MKVAASPRSMTQVATVLAFVISHTTYLAAQDDETGRCPKVCDGSFPSCRQPSPRGEGAPKGRIGHQRYEREWGRSVSSTSFMRAPYPPLCGPPSPCGEGLGGAPLRVDFCKRRCPKVAFKSLVTVPHDTFLYYSTGDE